MNKRIVLLVCVALFTLIGNGLAMAGNRPGAVTLSLNGSYYQFADKRYFNNIFMPNFGLAYDFDEHWAVEANGGLINTDINPPKVAAPLSVHGWLWTADGIYRLCKASFIEPYVIAGVGIMNLNRRSLDPKTQGNINAGLGSQFFATDSIAFRFEVRDIYTMSGGKNDVQVTGGLSFLFGGDTPRSAAAPVVAYK